MYEACISTVLLDTPQRVVSSCICIVFVAYQLVSKCVYLSIEQAHNTMKYNFQSACQHIFNTASNTRDDSGRQPSANIALVSGAYFERIEACQYSITICMHWRFWNSLELKSLFWELDRTGRSSLRVVVGVAGGDRWRRWYLPYWHAMRIASMRKGYTIPSWY